MKQQPCLKVVKIGDPPSFQTRVAIGQLAKPLATTTLKLDNADHNSAEHFVVIKNLTGTIFSLHFIRHNSVVIVTTQGLIHFPHLLMPVKNAAIKISAEPQAVFFDEPLTIPQMTTKRITATVDHPSEWNKTGFVTLMEKWTGTASLTFSHSLSTVID